MINFKNKKILVTGATGGIGREVVKKFISLEGNVVATGTNLERLDLLKKDFPNVNVIKFDISEHSKIEEFIVNASTQVTGLDIGSIPPIGLLFGIATYIDAGISDIGNIVFNAGSHTTSLVIPTSAFLEIVDPYIGHFADSIN